MRSDFKSFFETVQCGRTAIYRMQCVALAITICYLAQVFNGTFGRPYSISRSTPEVTSTYFQIIKVLFSGSVSVGFYFTVHIYPFCTRTRRMIVMLVPHEYGTSTYHYCTSSLAYLVS